MSENAHSLIVCIPGEAPVRHDLGADTVTFGRSPENDIQILVAEVSVTHGKLVREGDSYRIVDSGSTNGTQANGAKVGPEGAVLNPMARIVVGTVVPAFFVPVAALAATPLEELVASLESAAAPATPKTAPVAVAAPASPAPVRAAVPVAVAATPATPGGATVKLDQVRGPVPVKPVAQPPRAPGAPPAAPAPPGAAPQPLRPPGVAPAAAKPGAPQPLRPPGAAPTAPTIPLPKSPPKPEP